MPKLTRPIAGIIKINVCPGYFKGPKLVFYYKSNSTLILVPKLEFKQFNVSVPNKI